MKGKLTERLRKLTTREREALDEMGDEVRSSQPGPEDVITRTVKVGSTELPILNLNGLWALRKLLRDDTNEAEAMLTIVWVLRNQHRPELVDVVTDGAPRDELAALACEIDLAAAADILAAFEEMVAPFGKRDDGGKAAGRRGEPVERVR
ncbi:MAG: hypothetical protein JSW52_10885 [Candidatus Coatesbacteria bacterium]|nr:MAG: hypothetical protein JSW52_10885 [Candidatus Coatesbacteria bacterium]